MITSLAAVLTPWVFTHVAVAVVVGGLVVVPWAAGGTGGAGGGGLTCLFLLEGEDMHGSLGRLSVGAGLLVVVVVVAAVVRLHFWTPPFN